MNPNIASVNAGIDRLAANIKRVLVGYDAEIELVIAAMIASGHVLLTAVPGVGKTTLIKSLGASITGATLSRIQFTNDTMPGDITGVQVFDPRTSEFKIVPGPIFGNIVLADEINRTPPRTMSGLLEATAEGHVTIAGQELSLPEFFFLLASRNPIETEGTYPIGEAMADRFLIELVMRHVSQSEEVEMLGRAAIHRKGAVEQTLAQVLSQADIAEAKRLVFEIEENTSEAIRNYIVRLVRATRPDCADGYFQQVHGAGAVELAGVIQCAASPRAAIAMQRMAAAMAFRAGRETVNFDDVKAVALPALHHRIGLHAVAELNGWTPAKVVAQIMDSVPTLTAPAASKREPLWQSIFKRVLPCIFH